MNRNLPIVLPLACAISALALGGGSALGACPNPLTITTQPGASPTTETWTGYNDSGSNCVLGSIPTPTSGAAAAITPTYTNNTASGLVAKSSAGNFYGFVGTTSSTSGCFLVFNTSGLNTTGTVTGTSAPVYEVQASPNTTVSLTLGVVPAAFSSGISIGFSSTCGLVFTPSTTSLIEAQVQ